MIGWPKALVTGAAAAALSFGGGYYLGRGDGRALEQAAQAKAARAAQQKADRQQLRIDALEAAAASAETIRQGTHREIIREIPKIIERPVYSAVCTDADGVRLLNRAIANANGAD